MKFILINPLIIIILAGILVYSNSLFNGFVWDDEEQIIKNSVIQSISNLPEILSGQTFNTGGGGLSGWFFRPLLTTNFMLIYKIFGPNPFGFHLFQLIFHIVNGILFFKILQQLINTDLKKFRSIPLLSSLIFIIHPAISEAVVYISALTEVMYTLFSLLAFYLFLKNRSKLSLKTLPLISLSIFTALLYKESAFAIISLVFLFTLIFKIKPDKKILFTILFPILPYLLLRWVFTNTPLQYPQFSPISQATISQRLFTVPAELAHYLKIIIFPQDLSISQHFVITQPTSLNFYLPLTFISLFLSVIVYFSLKLKSKLTLFGLIWFLLGFFIISNLFPLDMTVAERWLYFPFLGLIISFASIIQILLPKNSKTVIFSTIVIFITLTLLGVRTLTRNANWKDGLTLYSSDIKISKNSFDLENNLGVELFRSQKFQEAKIHFQNSISLQPKWHFPYNNLGTVYEQENDLNKALDYYQKSLKLSDYYLAYENLTRLKFKMKDYQSAKETAQKALTKLPKNPNLWQILALAEYQLGDKQKALQVAQKAYALLPTTANWQIVTRLKLNQELKLKE